MLPGETIQSGGEYDGKCSTCNNPMPIGVLESGAGYYIGTWCKNVECEDFGPNSRESGYYRTSLEAEQALNTNNYLR